MLPYDTYLHLMDEIDRMVAALEGHPDPATRETAIALLNGVDMLHREGLSRLVASLREGGADDLVEEVVADDPVVRALLGLYDLVDLDLPEDEGREEPPAPAGFVPLDQLKVRGRRPANPDGRGGEEPR
jgi:hypothetical protein